MRWQEPEGRFISALLGAVETLGRLAASGQAMIEAVARDSRAAAEAEYAQAREVTKAAQLALKQARNAQLALVVEQENVTLRMIDQTLPLFAERLEKVLVIREQRWNADVRRRRYALSHVAARAVDLFVEMPRTCLAPLQRGDNKARIGLATGDLRLADDPAFTAPTVQGGVAEVLETAGSLAGADAVDRRRDQLRDDCLLQPVIAGQAEHVVHAVGFAPHHQSVPGEAGIAAQQNARPWPATADLRHDAGNLFHCAAAPSAFERRSLAASRCRPQKM